MLVDDSDVLVQSEDGTGKQERLRHVIEQPTSHVVDLDDLIRHERNAAHDEQHCTGVLRDFETFLFHGSSGLHHGSSASGTEQCADDVPENLQDGLYFLVHNFVF